MIPISWGMSMKLSRCVARSMVAHTRAAAAMPTGWLRPSSASERPGESDALRELVAVLAELRVGKQRPEPDQRADGARDQERDDDHPLRVDARRLGRGRALAGHPEVEAEAAAVEQHVVDDADDDGEGEEALQHDVRGEVESDRFDESG